MNDLEVSHTYLILGFIPSCILASFDKGVLKDFAKSTRKQLYQSFSGGACKRLWHWCFPVNFSKSLKDTYFYRTPPVTAC